MIDILITTVSFFGLYVILALSLNLEYGYTGIPNFGKVAFQAIGAFMAGALTAHMLSFALGLKLDIFSPQAINIRIITGQTNPSLIGVVFILSLLASMGVGALFGYLASYPALRVGEDYLALVLLVFGEIVRLVARNYRPIVGATHGLAGVPNPFAWIGDASIQFLCFAIVISGVALTVYVFCQRLENSPYGRLLKAIRENELASQCLGKKIFMIKGQVLAIGSAIAALGGALYTFYISFVMADDFTPAKTFDLWLIVILGGTTNNKGVILGALLVTVIDRVTRYLSGIVRVVLPIEINFVRYIATGIIMLLVIAYRPGGLIPEEPVKTPALEVVKLDGDS